MDHLLAELDYYNERIHPQCYAVFQARVKDIFKEYRIPITCQIRSRNDQKKIKAQLWLLNVESQEWFHNDMKEPISKRLVEKFTFCVDNY